MAKIPQLPIAEALQDSDLLVLEQGSGTKKLALSELVEYIDLGSILDYVNDAFVKRSGNSDSNPIFGDLFIKPNEGDGAIRLNFWDNAVPAYHRVYASDGLYIQANFGENNSGFEINNSYINVFGSNETFRGLIYGQDFIDDNIAADTSGQSLVPARYAISRRGTAVDTGQRISGDLEFENNVGLVFFDSARISFDDGFHLYQQSGNTGMSMYENFMTFQSDSSLFSGMRYGGDLSSISSYFTDDSLVHKLWVEDYVAANGGGIPYTGSGAEPINGDLRFDDGYGITTFNSGDQLLVGVGSGYLQLGNDGIVQISGQTIYISTDNLNLSTEEAGTINIGNPLMDINIGGVVDFKRRIKKSRLQFDGTDINNAYIIYLETGVNSFLPLVSDVGVGSEVIIYVKDQVVLDTHVDDLSGLQVDFINGRQQIGLYSCRYRFYVTSDFNWTASCEGTPKKKLRTQSNVYFPLYDGSIIQSISVRNLGTSSVSIRGGTTANGQDIFAPKSINAGQLYTFKDVEILKRFFQNDDFYLSSAAWGTADLSVIITFESAYI